MAEWDGWIQRLSGDLPAVVNGQPVTITSRYSDALFAASNPSPGFEYVREQVSQWYPSSQIEVDEYPIGSGVWKNLIATLPGELSPNEVVILSAHLDSTSWPSSVWMTDAPGAEDNGSGSAALLQAARLFRQYRFDRTVRFIWFTGEEQGLWGSQNYANDHDLTGIVGVINLDMFGYDSDNDGCFEIHVGTKAVSQPVGQCFMDTISNNSLDLHPQLINYTDLKQSDHATFWDHGIGALEVLESYHNYSSHPKTGCANPYDKNPYYHTVNDTFSNLNQAVGTEITRAALATAANLAGPQGLCFAEDPGLTPTLDVAQGRISWQAVAGADKYRISRLDQGCFGQTLTSFDTTETAWVDTSFGPGQLAYYRVEAVKAGAARDCVSTAACVSNAIPLYFPIIGK